MTRLNPPWGEWAERHPRLAMAKVAADEEILAAYEDAMATCGEDMPSAHYEILQRRAEAMRDRLALLAVGLARYEAERVRRLEFTKATRVGA